MLPVVIVLLGWAVLRKRATPTTTSTTRSSTASAFTAPPPAPSGSPRPRPTVIDLSNWRSARVNPAGGIPKSGDMVPVTSAPAPAPHPIMGPMNGGTPGGV